MSASLSRRPPARTVLLRMAADDARAQRIRDLKAARPDLRWSDIADAVGVRERSAIEWQKTGAMAHDNAVRLAGVFDVDVDWLWRGPRAETPDLIAALPNGNTTTQFDRIEAKLDELLARLPATQTPDEEVVAEVEAESQRRDPPQTSPAPSSKRKKRSDRAA